MKRTITTTISADSDAAAVYIRLFEGSASAVCTSTTNAELLVHIDNAGRAVGIEVLFRSVEDQGFAHLYAFVEDRESGPHSRGSSQPPRS